MENEPNWTVTDSKEVISGRVKLVEYSITFPNGEETKFLVDEARDSVGILMQIEKGIYLFSSQYRFPLRKTIIDIVGGGIDQGETLEEAITRECEEETGLIPQSLTLLGSYYANPGRSRSTAHLFFCNKFEEGKKKSDISEVIDKKQLSYEEVEFLINTGEIKDPGILISWSLAKSKQIIP